MPLGLVREVLELYTGYNPVLYMALLDARPPVEPYLHPLSRMKVEVLGSPKYLLKPKVSA